MNLITWIVGCTLNKYISLVYKTSTVEVIYKDDNDKCENSIFGFWHGESFCNYLLFKHIKDMNLNMNVIVTRDRRGDYISKFCEYNKVNPLRIPDGVKIKGYLSYIKEVAVIDNSCLAISFDGPLGPLHKPKKLAFMLSNHSNKNLIKVDTHLKRKIVLNNRWDKYIIPLPFNKIVFHVDNLGYIDDERLSTFNKMKDEIVPVCNG